MLESLRRTDPSEPLAQVAFYRLCRFVAAAFVKVFYRLRTVGAENVPGVEFRTRGPSATPRGCLLVANHQSHLDPPLIGVALGRRNMASLARTGLFGPAPLRWLLRGLGAIAIRQNESDTAAIRAAISELRKGRVVLIFPEGSRSPDGRVHPFKRGTWLLLSKAECDVLPAAVEGAFDAWPRDRTLPRLLGQRCMVAFGPPIPFERLRDLGADAALGHLASVIDTMRLDLRARLRDITRGRLPKHGAGDAAIPPAPGRIDADGGVGLLSRSSSSGAST